MRGELQRMRRKEILVMVRYYLRRAVKRSIGLLPFLIFAISFLMLVLAALLTVDQRLYDIPIIPFGPKTLEVAGTAYGRAGSEGGASDFRPLPGAVVESGGFRTTSDSNGAYQLRFRSQVAPQGTVVEGRG